MRLTMWLIWSSIVTLRGSEWVLQFKVNRRSYDFRKKIRLSIASQIRILINVIMQNMALVQWYQVSYLQGLLGVPKRSSSVLFDAG